MHWPTEVIIMVHWHSASVCKLVLVNMPAVGEGGGLGQLFCNWDANVDSDTDPERSEYS